MTTLHNNKLEANVQAFIIPNALHIYAETRFGERFIPIQQEIARLNHIDYNPNDKVVQIWWVSEDDLDSDNIRDHGAICYNSNGDKLRIAANKIEFVPVKLFEGHKEGDVIDIILPAQVYASRSDKNPINITMTFHTELSQLKFRYRRFGAFEDVLNELIFAKQKELADEAAKNVAQTEEETIAAQASTENTQQEKKHLQIKDGALTFNASVFIVPNSLELLGNEDMTYAHVSQAKKFQEKVAEMNGRKFHYEKDWLVQLWWTSKDELGSENIEDHGAVVLDEDGDKCYLSANRIGYLPTKFFAGHEEGDQVTFKLPATISKKDSDDEREIIMNVTAKLEQNSFRYRNYGPFEQLLSMLLSKVS